MYQWQQIENGDVTGWDESRLLRGTALAEAEEKLKQRPEDLSEGELFYIQVSVKLRDKEQRRRERVRRQTVYVYVLAGGSILILALGILIQWQNAEKRKEINNLERQLEYEIESAKEQVESAKEQGRTSKIHERGRMCYQLLRDRNWKQGYGTVEEYEENKRRFDYCESEWGK